MSKYSLYALLFLLLIYFFPQDSIAHESRPLYVEINETEPEVYSVNLKSPMSIPDFNIPKPLVPDNCVRVGEEIFMKDFGSWITKYQFNCSGGLTGKEIGIKYPVLNPSVSTLIRLNMLSGEKHTKLLNPNESKWLIPDNESKLSVAIQYTILGIEHIWDGIDHLLFLICLIIVARTGRRILITVTGFTIAHSITLVLSTLDIINLPVPPVEAAIALSIVFVATEIARGSKNSLTYRHPVIVSSSFGLLHGLGFAAVLKDVGLPQIEIPTSLLFFNIGVEIGQVIFVLCLIAIFKGFEVLIEWLKWGEIILLIRKHKLERVMAYVVGSLATFWMFERIYVFWS